jgi:predicted NUDIX family phosphoesterase
VAEKQDEEVLGVTVDALRTLGPLLHGVCTDVSRLWPLLLRSYQSFRLRSECEKDPSFKQLIPYQIFEYYNGPNICVYQYVRSKAQGEARLHDLRSIGIGGHLRPSDGDKLPGMSAYDAGRLRELFEEVQVDAILDERIAGFLYDGSNEVGKVHLGVVHVYRVPTLATVRPREDELLEGCFRPVSWLRTHYDELEGWSKLCLDAFYPERSLGAANDELSS